jgi:hypothetical protein
MSHPLARQGPLSLLEISRHPAKAALNRIHHNNLTVRELSAEVAQAADVRQARLDDVLSNVAHLNAEFKRRAGLLHGLPKPNGFDLCNHAQRLASASQSQLAYTMDQVASYRAAVDAEAVIALTLHERLNKLYEDSRLAALCMDRLLDVVVENGLFRPHQVNLTPPLPPFFVTTVESVADRLPAVEEEEDTGLEDDGEELDAPEFSDSEYDNEDFADDNSESK